MNKEEGAIELVNIGLYGNQVSLFTTSGAAGRESLYEAEEVKIGINVGDVATMELFLFNVE